MPNFVERFRKMREIKTANFLFFRVNLECSYTFLIVDILLNILAENQIDIHKLTCSFADVKSRRSLTNMFQSNSATPENTQSHI